MSINNKTSNTKNSSILGLIIGAGVGVAIGQASFDNAGQGLFWGACIGYVLGMIFQGPLSANKTKDTDNK